ncbi:hypothetical protein NAL19_3579 [Pectobacterium sp. F1-1]|nr:hypothetical protein NAL19_3579 [Pectobacterium sp. F1-1]
MNHHSDIAQAAFSLSGIILSLAFSCLLFLFSYNNSDI